ncbi:MAG: serine hydrolase domain-containing protein [Pseudomonadales bacterium]
MSIHGHLDPGFEPVAEAFLDGFREGRDVGAAVAVVVDGDLVVDLWHGHVDRRRETLWGEDTLVCMFSVTKAMTAICLLQAVDRGLLELDAPVSDYWPAFAAHGKSRITVRHLMTHQAGLVGFHQPVGRDLLYDWERVVQALEGESPWWEPGTRHGYHARTFGFLLGEVLRLCSGKTAAAWFRDQVAAPLDLDFWIGVRAHDLVRCAEMLPARMRPGQPPGSSASARAMMRDFNDLTTPTGAAFSNPAMGPGYMNSPAFRQAELPSMNGHGTARSVARMYDRLDDILSRDVLQQATTTQSLGPDAVLKSVTHFGLGLMLYHHDSPIGVRAGSFGHAGAGGSMAFHDPYARVSFCFAMNQMEFGVVTGGESATRVANALYDCL